MTFRRSLGVAVLALAVSATVPAMAQISSSTSSQPTASQQAGKQVNMIRQDMNKLTGDMARIRLKLHNDMLTKPEWASVVAAKKAADTNVEAAPPNRARDAPHERRI